MTAQRTPLAVVGVSALFPGSTDTEGFWRDILTGADRITDVPEAQWLIDDYYDPDPSAPDKTYAHRGGFLGEIDFDPLEWGTPPSLLEATDTAQLLALIVAQRVLDDATRGQFREMDRGRVSVILGVTSAQELLLDMTSRLQRPIWLESLRQAGVEEGKAQEVCQRIADHYVPWQEATFPGLLGNVIAGRIANRLDLGGTNCVTDAACASALSAVAMAAGELRMGSSDLVIVGGADTMTDIFMYMCFSKTPALSKSGDCRPFDQGADGTLLGEGIGMVALKRLADAERDGDPIYAVIKGIGASSDGRAKSVYAPSSEGQARALRRAYEEAGYAPEMVGLIEAHGTGTKAGDAAEIEGLLRVFGAAPPASIALGSVKSQIGHTKAAAGAAGLFKIVMALHSKTLPPTIKVTRPAEALIDGPLYVNTQARPWISAAPRRASVSALGFGGSNFHVTAEAYTGRHRAPRWRALPSELILVTAPDRAGLITRAEALLDAPGSLSHLAEQSQRGYTPQGARLAIIAHDRAALRERLGAALSRIKAGADHIDLPGRAHYGEGAREGGVAFLFPGQGSQYVNMGGALAMHYDQAMAAWEAAAAAGCCDASLHSVVFPPPAFDEAEIAAQTQRLKGTEWAQPAIGCVSLSMLNLLSDMGLRPDATGGHSFGEVTALYAAGAFDAATFLKIARRRGELMAEAAINPGAMTAVAAPAARLRARLAEWGSPVVLANDNAPTQAVLSGRVEDIEAVEARLQSVGISARRLSVDTAFHSEIVSGAAAPFAAFLDGLTISPPRCPVYANATAAPYAGTPEAIRAGLVDQIVAPVRFVSEIEAMHAAGIRVFVEIGPGAVLAGLTAAILKGRPHHAIATDRKGREGSVSWHDALGHLVALGFELDFAALWADQRPTAAPKPRAKMAVALTGANHRKPYPPKGGKAALTPPNLSAPTPILTPPTPIPQPTTPKLSAPTPIPQPTTPKLSAPTPIPQPTTPATPAQPHAASPLMAVQPSKPREITPMSPLRPDDAWLAAYQETQRQTASAHAAYQQAMAQSHAAFLRLAETSLVGLTALIQGQPLPRGSFAQVAPPAPAPMPPQAPVFEPVLATMPAPMPAPVLAPIPAPISAPMAPPAPVLAPIPAPMAPPAPNPAPMAPPAPVSAPVLAPVLAPIPAANDLVGLLLEVVADKTGYPAEMLSLEMTLEGDLGIDSIKRVEILSALQERDPRLPQLDTQTLAQQKTLGAIVEALGGAPTALGAPVVSSNTPNGLVGLLLEVVADKTGYPAEMLSLEMTLEGDLGIDSIKRVEILSALQERDPRLPQLDTQTLAQQKTLGAIVEALGGEATAEAARPFDFARRAPERLGRYALQAIEAPASGLRRAGLFEGPLHIIEADLGVAAPLAARLRGVGVEVHVVAALPASARRVVDLRGLARVADVEAAIQLNHQAFELTRALAGALSREPGALVLVQDTGGRLGAGASSGAAAMTRAWSGGLAGLARTADQEWPQAWARIIDLEVADRPPEALAEALFEELWRGGAAREVGLTADGRRWRLSDPLSPADQVGALRLDAADVVIVSGGARGVTAACVIALASASQAAFWLLGRTPLEPEPACCAGIEGEAALKRALLDAATAPLHPRALSQAAARISAGREIRRTLREIEAAGGRARYLSVDVTDEAALRAALPSGVTAILHGAGVIADKRLEEKTPEQFNRVFDTKIKGLRALLGAVDPASLKALILFSSVSARCGNVGQADYACANEVLNQFAAAFAAARPDVRVRALGWGPWAGGMVTPALEAQFRARGVPLIPLDVGAAMLVDELRAGGNGVICVLGGPPQLAPPLPDGAAPSQRLQIHLDRRSSPLLGDHQIGGAAALPMVSAFYLLAEAAETTTLEGLEVVRGIKIDDLDAGIDVDLIQEGAALRLEIEGRLHYRARRANAAEITPPPPLDEATLKPVAAPYEGAILFHGPKLQIIEAAWVGASASARLRGPLGAPTLDGALQLALLWAAEILGAATLPTRIERLSVLRGAVGPLRARLEGVKRGPHHAVAAAWLLDELGVVAHLEGISLHARP